MHSFALSLGRLAVPSVFASSSLQILKRQVKVTSVFGNFSSWRNITMASQAVEQTEQAVFKRLPTNVVPQRYNLRLEPNLETFVFKGKEAVDVVVSIYWNIHNLVRKGFTIFLVTQVKEETAEVLLNAVDLEVSSAVFDSPTSGSQTAEVLVDNKTEVLTLRFNPPLKPSEGTLNLVFTGTLNDKMKGFYRSKYRTASGEERYNAVTQFESTDARRAFPCWDEPAVKSTFDVTLVVPKDKVSLSNMVSNWVVFFCKFVTVLGEIKA